LRMNQYPHQLSGGQRQRVMIAMALMNKPDLLIADEPTTALDVTVQNDIIDLLVKLQKDFGMAMVFISHDLGVVSRVSEKVLVMEKGVIVEKGDTQTVLTAPEHPYTKKLLSCLWKLEDSASSSGTSEAGKPLISVENVSKTYHLSPGIFKPARTIHALRETSFEVPVGETLAIVGESGSGKSTLAKILNGLLLPDTGQVTIGGVALGALSSLERAKLIQPVFQDPYSTLNPVHTVGYTVARPLMIHEGIGFSKAKERVLPVLQSVGLGAEYFNRFPNQLSGGQRQRVAVARAIILKPQILICDEPTSALDVSVQEQILDLLVDLRKELGMTMIVISHDMAVIGYLADRVLVMHEGRIVERGPAEQVLDHPKDAYTKRLMASVYKVPRPDQKVLLSTAEGGRP
jgi:peptide/nickel transport system ATP-binding protein